MEVLFWFRKSLVNEVTNPELLNGTIQIRITVNTERVELGSTHIKCIRKAWNQENQSFTGRTEWASEQTKKIEKLRSQIHKIYEDLDRDGHEINANLIKQLFCAPVSSRRKKDASKSNMVRRFVYNVGDLFDFRKAADQKRVDRKKLSVETMKVRANYAKNILHFLESEGLLSSPATSLTENHMEDLLLYLLSDKGFGDKHTEKHMYYLKSVFSWAFNKSLIRKNPIAEYIVESSDYEPDTTHLEVPDLTRLIHFDFHRLARKGVIHPDTADRLEQERDAFVFNCFSGMHHVDYTSKHFHINIDIRGTYWLQGKRQKTGREFLLKLLEPAVNIYQKYGSDLTKLPSKSNQKRNDSLKLIAAWTSIEMNLSTKIARKTFADMALNVMMISQEDVAAMLGLTSTKYLRHYVKIRQQRLEKLITSWESISGLTA
ncbi:hypothetical protein ACS5NO_12875 [Larkinella sp. GY13]|uniref:hypothetical protein n=1 Tax=Larkinella sp. GY13 TaxID=3453720 RepID=UPI003EEB0AC7